MHICVLGAGVIGITTAHRLLQDGHQVTLVDANANPGSGASLGNGAQLSYSYVAPLAEPSVWRKWPQYLFANDSPLTLRPMPDSGQWRWLAQFLAASTAHRARETTIQLLRLAFFSRDEMARLRQQEPLDFLHRVAGKLVMIGDTATLESARRQVEFQAQHGCTQQVLSLDDCCAIEPVLARSAARWIGGVHTPDEEAGDCAMFCRSLYSRLLAHPKFRFVCARVDSPSIRNGRLIGVQAGKEKILADSFVLALGAQSAGFAKLTGFRLPVYPLKGYSITVPLDGKEHNAPEVSITDLSRKIVYAKLGDRLRVAGRVELVGLDDRIPQRAIDELKRGAAALMPDCSALENDAALQPWAGFRPATPTGLPVIGASPVAGLYLNVGHGSLGWTLACGSATLLAEQIAGRELPLDPAPYRYSGSPNAAAPA
jgi:D-amino-acid dehydrogenase